MPNYRRSNIGGASYFFTVNTYLRQAILTQPALRVALRHAIETVRSMRPFTVDAWVLMPDHLHCIWTLPQGDADFATRWGIIKQRVSRQCRGLISVNGLGASRQRRRESGLWQRRYWEHWIRDDDDYRRHMDYIHWNPVKHGLVKRVIEWPYSTFHRYVRDGVYTADWGIADRTDSRDYGE